MVLNKGIKTVTASTDAGISYGKLYEGILHLRVYSDASLSSNEYLSSIETLMFNSYILLIDRIEAWGNVTRGKRKAANNYDAKFS